MDSPAKLEDAPSPAHALCGGSQSRRTTLGPRMASSGSAKRSLEMLGGDRVHRLVALDVVLRRDPRVGMLKELGGEECSLRVVRWLSVSKFSGG